MKREHRLDKETEERGGWWKRRGRRQSNNSSTGQQLVLGCILIIPQAAREPHPISLALSLSLSLSSFLLQSHRSLSSALPRGLSRPLLVSQATRGIPPKREETKEEEEPRCTAHRFSPPFNHSRLAVQPLIVSPIPSLSLGTRIFTREKKERKGILFEGRNEGGIVKDDESSFDPFEGEASLPWLKYRLIKPTLHFHPREFLSFAKTSIELTINNDIASTNKSSLQTSRSNPRIYANFQISAIWFITVPQRILFKTRLKSGPRLSLSLSSLYKSSSNRSTRPDVFLVQVTVFIISRFAHTHYTRFARLRYVSPANLVAASSPAICSQPPIPS